MASPTRNRAQTALPHSSIRFGPRGLLGAGITRWPGAPGYTGMIGEQELDFLKDEADATRKRLGEIEARVQRLSQQGESWE